MPGKPSQRPIDRATRDAPAPAEPPVPPAPPSPANVNEPHPSTRSLRGLDWFIFFVADVQTGFGPFISVYLTSQKWTQVDIGLMLSTAGLISLFAQLPGGALVDWARSERLVAGIALAAISAAAMAYAALPIFPVVMTAAVMHALASCVLGPCIIAMALGLVGHAAIGERLGRNARFASIGNGLAAAAMGACGYLLSPRAVFFVTAALLVPTLIALSRIRAPEIDPDIAHGFPEVHEPHPVPAEVPAVVSKRPLLILAGCVMLFHFANAAMLPLMGSVVTTRSSQWATVLIAACIVVPQLVVAAVSPWVGNKAQIFGRRRFLLLAFAALPIRGLLFATVTNPYLLVVVQVLDGITAAALGVMVPLMVADLTRGTGRFNLSQGFIGMAAGIGASISPTFAGYLSDHFGSPVAFTGLALVATLALICVSAFMPETRPETK